MATEYAANSSVLRVVLCSCKRRKIYIKHAFAQNQKAHIDDVPVGREQRVEQGGLAVGEEVAGPQTLDELHNLESHRLGGIRLCL